MVKEIAGRRASPSRSGADTNAHADNDRADRSRAGGASSGLERVGYEAYCAHHLQCAEFSLQRLLNAPLASLLTWLVIAVALALPAGLMVLLDNLSGLTDNLAYSSQLTIYMELSQDDQQSALLARQIEARKDVDSVDFISRKQALEEFKLSSGWGDVLAYLDENPLPSVIVVEPAVPVDNVIGVGKLNNDLQALSGVQSVQADLQWVRRIAAVFELFERFLIALGLLFGTAVILIIGNTVRLTIENRRDEIVVTKLVGGTDAYVRRPFLYIGFWYGLIGAVIAWLLVNLALLWLTQPVNDLAALYFSQYTLRGLTFTVTLMLLAGGACLGMLGAWLAVSRHLDDIEPS